MDVLSELTRVRLAPVVVVGDAADAVRLRMPWWPVACRWRR